MINPIDLHLDYSYANWSKQFDDKIVMMSGIMSSYIYYASKTYRPVSQAEFTRYRLIELCQENRMGWSKKDWRELIINMVSNLWACEIIDDLGLNDLETS